MKIPGLSSSGFVKFIGGGHMGLKEDLGTRTYTTPQKMTSCGSRVD